MRVLLCSALLSSSSLLSGYTSSSNAFVIGSKPFIQRDLLSCGSLTSSSTAVTTRRRIINHNRVTSSLAMTTTAGVPAGTVESHALEILKDLKEGKKTVADLLGPLFPSDPVNQLTPQVSLRAGNQEVLPVGPEADAEPLDDYNTKLINNVHPPDYDNPEPLECYDLVAIGAGVSGLLSVIMGSALGKKVALIEKHYMGGDCLNVGCVPSKALIACAKRVVEVKEAADFGVILPAGEVKVDFGAVMQRMRRIRSEISEHDSVARYSRDFCEHVFLGDAKLTSKHTLEVAGKTLKFKKCMIATGGSASIPPVPGLSKVPHLINTNIFNLTELPPRLCVIGAGPIGLELAQSFARFGSKVICFEAFDQLLPREDPEAAAILKKVLEEKDGVVIKLGAKIKRVEHDPDSGGLYCAPWQRTRVVLGLPDGTEEVHECEGLLNATGRTPNVANIGLDAVGVDYDNRRGVVINDNFQTSVDNIYSCGDCASQGYKFTHSADFQARLAIRHMFLGDGTARLSSMLIPWCTYTDPEVAHVGLYEKDAADKGIEFESYKREVPALDRSRCEGVKDGFIKITCRKGSDQIIGATIVAPHAGDMICELAVCIQNGVGAAALGGTIHPYPTTAEGIRHAAAQYNKHFRTPAVNEALKKLMEKEGGLQDL